MIDRGDIRQCLIVAAISGFTAGRWLWLSEQADSLTGKIQRSGRNGQRD